MKIYRWFLFLHLLMAATCSAQQLSIATNDSRQTIYIGKPVSGQKAKGYIFSTNSGKLRRKKPKIKPSVIVTGIFSGDVKSDVKSDATAQGKQTEKYDTKITKHKKKQDKQLKQDKHTIAWTTKDGEHFHDHLSPHKCPTEIKDENGIKKEATRIWISEIKDLVALVPCNTCFIKVNNAPEFISKECGGLDIASATTLLNNPGFIEWSLNHLPISKLSFLTSSKLLVTAKTQMTKEALKQLSKETAAAFRRHTWKVIEVISQNSDTTEQESSF